MIAPLDDRLIDDSGRGLTLVQGEEPLQLGGQKAAMICATAVDPAQLWLPVARLEALNQPSVSQDRMSWPALATWL